MQDIKIKLLKRSNLFKKNKYLQQVESGSLSLTHYQSPSGNDYVINTGAFLHIPARVAIRSPLPRGNVKGKRVELSKCRWETNSKVPETNKQTRGSWWALLKDTHTRATRTHTILCSSAFLISSHSLGICGLVDGSLEAHVLFLVRRFSIPQLLPVWVTRQCKHTRHHLGGHATGGRR